MVVNCHEPYTIDVKIERLVKSEDLSKFSSNSNRATPRDVISVGSVAGGLGYIFDTVETVTFPSLPLCDFSRLLPLVTNVGEYYQILKHQCYWFCWIIKEAAIRLWRGNAAVGIAKRQEGGYGSVSKQLGRDPTSLEKLLELYNEGVGARQPKSVGELEAALHRRRKAAQEAQANFEMQKKEVQKFQAQSEILRAQRAN